MHGLRRVAAAAAGAGVFLAFGFAPARAVSVPPVELPLPSGLIGSYTDLTAAERVALLRTSTLGMDFAAPAAAGTGAEVATASGAVTGTTVAGVALAGLFVGYEGTTAVMDFMGVENTGSLNPLSLFSSSSPATGFVPNTGVVASPAGWAGGLNQVSWDYTLMGGGGWWSDYGWHVGHATLTMTGALPVFGHAASTLDPLLFSLTGYLAGSCGAPNPNSVPSPSVGVTAFMNDGVGYGVQGNPSFMWSTSGTCVLALNPATIAYGLSGLQGTFDHLVVSVAPSVGDMSSVTWYPQGHPLYQGGSDPNPGRAWETRWTCTGGGAASARSATFLETDASFPSFPEASCAGGTVASFGIWEVSPGGGVPDHQVYSWTPTQPLIDWQTNYPRCSDGSCKLELFRVDPTTQGQISCFANPEACLNWATDPQLSGQMQCMYAGVGVPLSECNAYVPTFNVMTGTKVQTNTGIKPSTDVLTFADPATGEPQPNPSPDPGPGPNPQPGPDAGVPDGCPPPFSFTLGGMGYWVTKGVGCALSAAFVPPPGTGSELLPLAPDSGISELQGIVGQLSQLSIPTGTCGLIVDEPVATLGGQRISINTCGPPWSEAGALRSLVGVVFVVATTLGVVRILSRALGIRSVVAGGVKASLRGD